MKPTVYIFDMNSHFARIYSVKTADGVPTHTAAFDEEGRPIFCMNDLKSMVQKEMNIVRRAGFDNTHIVMVFDHKDKNFRHEMYDLYKASRPEKPEEWVIQESMMYDMFKGMGYPCLRVPGVEADDVIATLVTKLSKNGITSVMFTGDKDIASLCDENTLMFNGRTKTLMNAQDVHDKYGVPPASMIDFLAMLGDKVDNVPGIDGAGPKSAVLMANAFSIEEFVEQPDRVNDLGIRGAKRIWRFLVEFPEKALLAKALISLKKDVPLNVNLSDLKVKQI